MLVLREVLGYDESRIAELRAILGDPARIDALIREELLEVKQAYGRHDDRRTEIVMGEDSLELEDMIAEEDMVIAITRSGYIKRLPVTAYREQRRGGIGVMGMELKEDDYIEHLFVASTHDYILFFTSVGKVYRLKVHELPLGSRQSKGRAIQNLLPFRQDEQVRAVIQTRNFEEAKHLVFATKNGVIKMPDVNDTVTMHVVKCEVVEGQFGEQCKFTDTRGDSLYLPRDSADRHQRHAALGRR